MSIITWSVFITIVALLQQECCYADREISILCNSVSFDLKYPDQKAVGGESCTVSPAQSFPRLGPVMHG